MTVAERVLAGLGPALRDQAGPVLEDLVDALTSELNTIDQLLQPTEDGWAGAFDLDTTPAPAWLGNTTGTRVPGGLTVDQQRAYVLARPSWRRGTPAAMVAAVRATLTGLQRVTVDERDGSPWRLTVTVYAAETPDEAATLAAALSQKPVGIVLTLQVAQGASYAHMTALHGPTYADEAAEFPTYGDAIAHLPEP